MGKRGSFAGRSVVITGAGGGIGGAMAECFAAEGAWLSLLDVDQESASMVAKEVRDRGGTALAAGCDVTSWESVVEATNEVMTVYGRVDVLVINAGITQLGFFQDTEIEVIRRVMEVNFFGGLHCVKAALPSLLKNKGHVVALSSIAGIGPLATRSGYSASKHAMQGFFESLRAELHGSGVGVTLVCPSFVNTGMGEKGLGADGGQPGIRRTVTGTPADPRRVAESIVRATRSRKRLVLPSRHSRLAYGLSRAYPALYERVMTNQIVPGALAKDPPVS